MDLNKNKNLIIGSIIVVVLSVFMFSGSDELAGESNVTSEAGKYALANNSFKLKTANELFSGAKEKCKRTSNKSECLDNVESQEKNSLERIKEERKAIIERFAE